MLISQQKKSKIRIQKRVYKVLQIVNQIIVFTIKSIHFLLRLPIVRKKVRTRSPIITDTRGASRVRMGPCIDFCSGKKHFLGQKNPRAKSGSHDVYCVTTHIAYLNGCENIQFICDLDDLRVRTHAFIISLDPFSDPFGEKKTHSQNFFTSS